MARWPRGRGGGGGGGGGGGQQRGGYRGQRGKNYKQNVGQQRDRDNDQDNVYVPPNARRGANPNRGRGGRQNPTRGRGGKQGGFNNREDAAPSIPTPTSTSSRPAHTPGRSNGRPRGSGLRSLRSELASSRQTLFSSIPRYTPLPVDKSNLRHHGVRYGDIPKSDVARRFEWLEANRQDEIKAAVAAKKMNDPDPSVKINLRDAIRMVGECVEMCSEHERTRRIYENDCPVAELDPSTLGGDRKDRRPDESRMVKAFKRPAAGDNNQIPSDLRTPQTLSSTLDYLFNLLADDESFAANTNYVWDRTRAVRNDFSIQAVQKTKDVDIMINCYTRIARFHILSMHTMTNPAMKQGSYNHSQEVDQLKNTLITLNEVYSDNKTGVLSPDEPEIQAYRLVADLIMDTPYSEDRLQGYSPRVLEHPTFRAAMEIYKAGQLAKRTHGPLTPSVRQPVSRHDIRGFFDAVLSPETPYLLACVAELMFNRVRHYALKSIVWSYRMGGDAAVEGWLIGDVQRALCFDTVAETEDFCARYDLEFKQTKAGDDRFLHINHIRRGAFPEDVGEADPRCFSAQVEAKRSGRSFISIIQTSYSGVEQNETVASSSRDSLFVPEKPDPSTPKTTFATPLTGSPLDPAAKPFQPNSFLNSAQPKSPTPTAPGSPFGASGFVFNQNKTQVPPAPFGQSPIFGQNSTFGQATGLGQTSKPVQPNPFAEKVAAASAARASVPPTTSVPAQDSVFGKAQSAQTVKPNPFAALSSNFPSTASSSEPAKPTTSTPPPNPFLPKPTTTSTPTKPSSSTPSFTSPSGQTVQPGVFDATKGPIRFAQPTPAAPSAPAASASVSSATGFHSKVATAPPAAATPAPQVTISTDTPTPASSVTQPVAPTVPSEDQRQARFSLIGPDDIVVTSTSEGTYVAVKDMSGKTSFAYTQAPPREPLPNAFDGVHDDFLRVHKPKMIAKLKDRAMDTLAYYLLNQKECESMNYWMVVTQVQNEFAKAKEVVDRENLLKTTTELKRMYLLRKYFQLWREKRNIRYLRRTGKERRHRWRSGQLGPPRYEADVQREIEALDKSRQLAKADQPEPIADSEAVTETVEQTLTPRSMQPSLSQADLSSVRLPGTGFQSTQNRNEEGFKKPLTPASLSGPQSGESVHANNSQNNVSFRRSFLGNTYNDPTEFVDRTESDIFRARAMGINPWERQASKRPLSISPRDGRSLSLSTPARQTDEPNKRLRTSTGGRSTTPSYEDLMSRFSAYRVRQGKAPLPPSSPVPTSSSVGPKDADVPAYRSRTSRFVPREAYGLGPEAVRAARVARGLSGSFGARGSLGGGESEVGGGVSMEGGEWSEEVEEEEMEGVSWDGEEGEEESEEEEEDEDEQYAQRPGASADDAIELSD